MPAVRQSDGPGSKRHLRRVPRQQQPDRSTVVEYRLQFGWRKQGDWTSVQMIRIRFSSLHHKSNELICTPAILPKMNPSRLHVNLDASQRRKTLSMFMLWIAFSKACSLMPAILTPSTRSTSTSVMPRKPRKDFR